MEFGDFPFDRQVCDFLVKDLKLRETKAPKLENFQWEPPNLIAEHVQRVSLVQIFLRVKTCSAQMLISPEYDISLTMEGNQGGAREEKNCLHLLLCNAHYNMSVRDGVKTLPKAQRTRGLSYYNKFFHKS